MAIKLSDDDIKFLRNLIESNDIPTRKSLQTILIDQLAGATGRREDVMRAATMLRAAGDAEASARRYDQLTAAKDCDRAILI